MAVYKVPQDVEADDKLIGPFSFRQFIYLIIVAGSGFIGWMLAQLFIPLAIIVLPVIVFFGALALPLRKDQPMETYMAAIVSYYLKPHKRLWSPDGTQTFVEITAPKVVEVHRTKDLSQDEAERRLSYLASIVDSRGWAVRGIQDQSSAPGSSLNSDVYFEAQSAPDILDTSTGIGHTLETKLDQADARRHQEMLNQFRNQASGAVTNPQPQAATTYQPPVPAVAQQPQTQPQVITPAPVQQPAIQSPVAAPTVLAPQPPVPAPWPTTQPQAAPDDMLLQTPAFNPYPAMHQSMINPVGAQTRPTTQTVATLITAPEPKPEPEKPSEKPLSPDIINLANNPDLSVETIAREANRIHEKEKKLSEDEVVISLR